MSSWFKEVAVDFDVIAINIEGVLGDGTDMAMGNAKKQAIDHMRTQGTGG